MRGELEARDVAIATLQTELEAREQAIAKLELELEARGDKQLTLFPPEPEPTPEPEPVTASPAVTGTLTKGGLAKYILEKFPDSDLGKTKDFEKIYNAIGDAVRDKDKKAKGKEFSRLFYLEKEFGFKFVGKIGKENRFKLV